MPAKNRCRVSPHRRRKPDKFVNRLTLHSQASEQRGDLRVGSAAGQNLLHRGFGLRAREVFVRNDLFERFVNHMVSANERIRLLASVDAGKLLRLHLE